MLTPSGTAASFGSPEASVPAVETPGMDDETVNAPKFDTPTDANWLVNWTIHDVTNIQCSSTDHYCFGYIEPEHNSDRHKTKLYIKLSTTMDPTVLPFNIFDVP